MSKEKLEQILKLLPELTVSELDAVHEASLPDYEKVVIVCPKCHESTTVTGEVQPCDASGTLPLCVDPDTRKVFYDWYHSDVDVAVDACCENCAEYIGTRYEVQELYDSAQLDG